ncbi:MAG: hypothetical protein HRU09_07240 [Oligoflexales bacterium]|nr:hypothetical protein [Oligoflexales bacterium]
MTSTIASSHKKWKKIGKIGKAHGLKGAFYLGGRKSLWTEAASIMSVGSKPELGVQSELSSRQVNKGRVILSLSSFSDRTSLEAYQGQDLWCLELEPSTEFDYDRLIGFDVITACGQTIGQVSEFYNHGASDTVEIINTQNEVLEIPFIEAYVKGIDDQSSLIRLSMTAEAFTDLWQSS